MTEVTSLSASRVPATSVKVGDRIALVGLTYFTVEWARMWEDGGVYLAGLRSTGEPHVSTLSAGALVSRVSAAEVSQ